MNGIAVVIPCRNLGLYVRDALDSVHAQTRPASEIVVVDDGSDDLQTRHTLTAASRAGTYVIRTPPRGVGAARNIGIRATSSPYLVLLDADDTLAPTYLERLGIVLDAQTSLDFVTCGLQAFGESAYRWTPPPCTVIDTLVRGGPHISTMFRRGVWEAVGGFDEDLDGYEDTDFWLRALTSGHSGQVIAEPLLCYRVRGGSRYARVLRPTTFFATRKRVYGKHWPALESCERPALILAQDRFLHELQAYGDQLRTRKAGLERCLASLDDEIAESGVALSRAGLSTVDLGDCRRTQPLSSFWGIDRGLPIDRYYIERFLTEHQSDIVGRVLEVKDSGYTEKYGNGRVLQSDVVDIDAKATHATIHADLTNSESFPQAAFDCVILTQTLHVNFDIDAIVRTAYRVLKPGGVLLATIPCVSRIADDLEGSGGHDFWRLTPAAVSALFAAVFPWDDIQVVAVGNVMTCAAFLHGFAAHELASEILTTSDPMFPLLSCVRTVKAGLSDKASAHRRGLLAPLRVADRAVILGYHRVGSYTVDTHRLAIDTDGFRAHMKHLREHYNVMSLDGLYEGLLASSLPERAVAVTFDDGYVDGLTIIAPILADLGIAATFFVTTERLDDAFEYWWDTLERIMTSARELPEYFDVHADGQDIRPAVTAADRASLHQRLVEVLHSSSLDQRNRLMARLAEWSGDAPPVGETHRRMTAAEISHIAEQPNIAIGAHTVHHLNLPTQPLEVQRREVFDCKRRLEGVLQRPITCFAYPYGELDLSTLRIVREAGFRLAVAVDDRPVRLGADRFALPRCEVSASISGGFSVWLANRFAT